MPLSDFVSFFMPIIWMITSLVVGLACYKTSKALIDKEIHSENLREKIRVGGSFAIVLLSYFSLKMAIPPERLRSINPDSTIVSKSSIFMHSKYLTDVEHSFLDLKACTYSMEAGYCKNEVTALQDDLDKLKDSFAELSKNE